MRKKILITGANGFVGKALSQYLSSHGHDIIPLQVRLGEVLNESQLTGADALIHCAWDRHKINKNVAGSLSLKDQCRAHGLHFIFISSMAAHGGAHSGYGREKLAVERALSPEDCIIKPGTIVGNGGLFANTYSLAKALPILPVFYASKAYLQTIYINDLCAALLHVVEMRNGGIFALAHKQAVHIKEFYRQIAALAGKKPLLVNLSGNMALAAIRVFEKLGLRLPISSDNLLGLKYVTLFETSDSCRRLGIEPLPFEASLQKLKHQ